MGSARPPPGDVTVGVAVEGGRPAGGALARYKGYQSGLALGSGYRRGASISSGADGDVFRAVAELPQDGSLEVAIKHMRLTSANIQRHAVQELSAVFHARRRYAEEIGAAHSAGHPNLVEYLDWFAGSGGAEREIFLVMELCDFTIGDMIFATAAMRSQYERRCLDVLRSKQGVGRSGAARSWASAAAAVPAAGGDPELYRFTEREMVKILYHMLSALAFLNRCGILHRDIKSENMLWSRSRGFEGCYKLADFGVAVCLPEGQLCAGDRNCGTLWTMAPEVLARRPHGPGCDVWSLGCVLFEAAILEKPFASKELLAYKTSYESNLEGSFWRVLSEAVAPRSSRPVTPNPRSMPSSPAGSAVASSRRSWVARAAKGGPASAPRSPTGRLDRTNSVPSLPSLRRSAGRRASGAMAPTSSGGGSSTQSSPRRPASAGNGKSMFLKKRCLNRWFYSAELRALIFEDMLEEDVHRRPWAANLLEDPRLRALVATYRVGDAGPSIADCLAQGFGEPRKADCDEDSDQGTGTIGAATVSESSGESSNAAASRGASIAKALRRVTGEAFQAAMRIDAAASKATQLGG